MSVRVITVPMDSAGVRRIPVNAARLSVISLSGPVGLSFSATAPAETILPVTRPGKIVSCAGFIPEIFVVVSAQQAIAGGTIVLAASTEVDIDFPPLASSARRELLTLLMPEATASTAYQPVRGGAGTAFATDILGASNAVVSGQRWQVFGGHVDVVTAGNGNRARIEYRLSGMPPVTTFFGGNPDWPFEDTVRWFRTTLTPRVVGAPTGPLPGGFMNQNAGRIGFGIGGRGLFVTNYWFNYALMLEARHGTQNWLAVWYQANMNPTPPTQALGPIELPAQWAIGKDDLAEIGVGRRNGTLYAAIRINHVTVYERTERIHTVLPPQGVELASLLHYYALSGTNPDVNNNGISLMGMTYDAGVQGIQCWMEH